MGKTIKIGFLFPYSSIHPNMSQDIMDGFHTATSAYHGESVQFYPEFVNQGDSSDVKAAINKLLMFHQVDVLSGFLSYAILPEIIPIISRKRTLCFFFDMGEYLPPLHSLPETLFFNSFQFWQLEYALGNWAQKQFGGKGAVLTSVYDAGFHINSSFWQGAISAKAKEMDMHVLPYHPEVSDIKSVLQPFFAKIEKSGVNYLHAIFCGNEALDFFSLYKQSGLHKKIPLVVSPHMASESVLSKISNLGLGFYSASGWNYNSTSNINKLFKKQFETFADRKASIFALMGYEMGLALLPVCSHIRQGDVESVMFYLKNNCIDGPRGEKNFWIGNKEEKPFVEIEKIALQTSGSSKFVIEQGVAMEYNHVVFEDIHNLCVSGWKNPYLCI